MRHDLGGRSDLIFWLLHGRTWSGTYHTFLTKCGGVHDSLNVGFGTVL
jgi:hypothetical protein